MNQITKESLSTLADILWEKWGKDSLMQPLETPGKPFDDSGINEEIFLQIVKTNDLIKQEFDTLRDFVIQKNITYGNSLQNPIGVFQKEPLQGILGRIDDKLSRIKTVGINDETEDTIGDLIGYLVHLKIMIKK